ncbi:MAG: hypothetical protein G3M70_00270 [Candidatus Nitronauta litoralis]|uniref:EfeO-type cupredoxin-like domain-containing protein n=1 Tax=Candidatus Nitronauta litoralis TaxID=2705533 RepID=A0A7T0FZ32_9BACT|nr:MAG: hypothetical protein G3M70_00270 [Candidatus Nitronauta litoralis]
MGLARGLGKSAFLVNALILILIYLLVVSPALAKEPRHLIKLNKVSFDAPVKVFQDSPVTLKNDWGFSLHQTSISQIESGAEIARIQTVMAGQTVSLEFPREGEYSICYFLSPEQQPEKERCFSLNVVPLKTA